MFWQDLIDFVCRPWPLSIWLLALVGFVVQARLSFTCLGCFRKRSPRLSHNLQINIFCWLLYSFAILLWQTYGFVTVDPMQRSVYALFFIGLFMTSSGHALSTSIMFLMFERVLIISKSGFHARHQLYIVRLTVATCTCVFLFVLVGSTIREMPLAPLTDCQSFFCIMKNGSNVINSTLKTVIGAINVVVSIVFVSILFFYTRNGVSQKNGRYKTANLLVLYAIGSEIIFVIFPRIFELSCNAVNWLFCPYNQMVMGSSVEINTFLTGVVYLFVLKAKSSKQNASVTVVSAYSRKE